MHIQLIKVIVDIFGRKEKSEIANLWRSGGFPSVHSGISSSITTLVALMFGVGSMYFAVCFIFSFLFRYDAANVRFQA
jgi:uncharacterized protein